MDPIKLSIESTIMFKCEVGKMFPNQTKEANSTCQLPNNNSASAEWVGMPPSCISKCYFGNLYLDKYI